MSLSTQVKMVQGKSYCVVHLRCYGCFRNQSDQIKLTKLDGKLLCFDCWDVLPSNVRKSAERYQSDEKNKF